jgi:hypothetical protein
VHCQQERLAAALWNEEYVFLVNFLPGRSTLNSDCYIQTLRSLNACLCWVCPTRKLSEVLLIRDNVRPHSSVHTTETIIRFGWVVLLRLPCTPDPTPSVSPVWSFVRWPGMTPLRRQGTAEHSTSGCRGRRAALLGRTTVSCSKVEEVW